MRGPHATRVEVQANYLRVLRITTAVPNARNWRGAFADNALRVRGASIIEGRMSEVTSATADRLSCRCVHRSSFVTYGRA